MALFKILSKLNPAAKLRGIRVSILRDVSAPPILFNSPSSSMQSTEVLRRRNKKYFIAIFLAVFIALAFLWREPAVAPVINNYTGIKQLKINGQTINIEIADTLVEQEKGLSGRQSLPENQGMLFIFQAPGRYSYWMKDMNFGLDFVWISGDEIIEITKNIKPEDYSPPNSLASKDKIDKVLEINAGMADKLGIKVGDKIEF